MRACLLRGRPLVVRPGRLRLVVQSGLDEFPSSPMLYQVITEAG